MAGKKFPLNRRWDYRRFRSQQPCAMIRYYNNVEKKIVTAFVDLVTVGHARAVAFVRLILNWWTSLDTLVMVLLWWWANTTQCVLELLLHYGNIVLRDWKEDSSFDGTILVTAVLFCSNAIWTCDVTKMNCCTISETLCSHVMGIQFYSQVRPVRVLIWTCKTIRFHSRVVSGGRIRLKFADYDIPK